MSNPFNKELWGAEVAAISLEHTFAMTGEHGQNGGCYVSASRDVLQKMLHATLTADEELLEIFTEVVEKIQQPRRYSAAIAEVLPEAFIAFFEEIKKAEEAATNMEAAEAEGE